MTLAEKIAALRGARELSQGDLAEALDVSRQSVSKWETGQSVPELDKIIKLADLFGITVDALVRDGPAPEPPPAAQPETKIVYVKRPREGLARTQALGAACAVIGGVIGFLAVVRGDPEGTVLGMAMVIASLPLLLLKKRAVLAFGWLAWAAAYLCLCNPAWTGVPWQPFWGVWAWCPFLGEGPIHPVVWLLWLSYAALSALTVVLPVYTGRLCWKRWKKRNAERHEQQTA